MGDEADYIVDRMLGEGPRRSRHDRPRRAPTCKRCGETDLVWRQEASGKWWLYDGFRPHRCPITFEDET